MESLPSKGIKTQLKRCPADIHFLWMEYGVIDIFHTVRKIQLQGKVIYYLSHCLQTFKLPQLLHVIMEFVFCAHQIIIMKCSVYSYVPGRYVTYHLPSLCSECHCFSKESITNDDLLRSFKKDQNNKNTSYSQSYDRAKENNLGTIWDCVPSSCDTSQLSWVCGSASEAPSYPCGLPVSQLCERINHLTSTSFGSKKDWTWEPWKDDLKLFLVAETVFKDMGFHEFST